MRVDLNRLRERVGNVRSDFVVLVAVGVVVGIGSGLAGLLLHFGLHELSLHELAAHKHWPWPVKIALPAAGALLSWLFLHRLLDEREHGIGEVIWAAAREGGRMPAARHLRAARRLVVDGGLWWFGPAPEGPIAYSGAAIGSNTASALNLTERRRVSLLGCGVAGAISSIFNAPVTGLLFALEVVLGEWASFHVLPIAISSVVANVIASTALAGAVLGVPEAGAVAYLDYVWLIGLAALAGLGAVLLLRAIHAGAWFFSADSQRPAPWQPLVGGLLVGVLGLLAPQIVGEGYAGIRATFSRRLRRLLDLGALWHCRAQVHRDRVEPSARVAAVGSLRRASSSAPSSASPTTSSS